MKTFKKIMNLVPLMLLWLMLSAFVWSWIFTFLTEAPAEEKIVLFVECDVYESTHLSAKMEEFSYPGIRMAQVKPFSYSMMSSKAIRASDLYIVSEPGMTEYLEWFMPLPENALSIGEVYEIGGVPYGIKVYDGKTQDGRLKNHIAYSDINGEPADYYLAFGNASVHVKGNPLSADDAAVFYAERLFEIDSAE